MNRHVAAGSAGFAFVLVVIVVAVTLALSLAFSVSQVRPLDVALIGLWLVTTAFVGALIASRRSSNPIGWIFLTVGLFLSGYLFARQYAALAALPIFVPGSLPLATAMAWFSHWLPVPGLALIVFLVLLFPTGTLPSPGWRWVGRSAAAAIAALTVAIAFRPGPIESVRGIANPLGMPGAESLFRLVESIATGILLLVGVAAVASQLVRLRRADEEERHQVKWFGYAVALAAAALLLVALGEPEITGGLHGFFNEFGFLFGLGALLGMPVAVGVAILKYRLYDIDRIISRTVSYGLLTGLLAAVYLGAVFALQGLLRPITGESQLAVAGATLAVAALFGPARRRVQVAVDRRFNRARYDAQRTVEEFRARLRDEVDLDQLGTELVFAVGKTVEPAQVSLWLRSREVRR